MKTVIEMAREAGFSLYRDISAVDGSIAHLRAFADLVRADEREACALLFFQTMYTADQMRKYAATAVEVEREACAKVCEEILEQYRGTDMGKHAELVGDDCATAIRART
jgi:hypothetical protein